MARKPSLKATIAASFGALLAGILVALLVGRVVAQTPTPTALPHPKPALGAFAVVGTVAIDWSDGDTTDSVKVSTWRKSVAGYDADATFTRTIVVRRSIHLDTFGVSLMAPVPPHEELL